MRKLSILALALAVGPSAIASPIFSNIPSVLPGNVPSLGYQATQTAEFGNKVTFAGTDRNLTSVDVGMSNWASASDNPGFGDSTGYDHDLTFNIYNEGAGDSVGTLIGSVTKTVHVPWKPVGWGFNGILFTTSFDFTGLAATLPDTVIFGLAYDTQTWGAHPTGVNGPYNSLNFGLSTVGPSVGTDVDPTDAYWNTMTAANYTDGGTGGVGTFRRDTNWAPYSAMVQFNAVPEPASMAALGLGVLALIRKRRAR